MGRGIYFGLGFKNDLHCTLVYLGKAGSYKKWTEEQLITVAKGVAECYLPIQVSIDGTDWFGDETPALTLVPDEALNHVRDAILARLGRKTGTSWRPHISLPSMPTEYPAGATSRFLIFRYGDNIYQHPFRR